MSNNLYVFVGAYMEVKCAPYEDKITDRWCESCNVRITQGGAFCVKCGDKIQDKERTITKGHNDYTLLGDDFIDELCGHNNDVTGETIIFRSRGRSLRQYDDYGGGSLCEITPDVIKEQIDGFKRNNAKVIEHLRSLKDVISIEFKFGSFSYYN